jgi:outer membrane lipoprotein-sorting protein
VFFIACFLFPRGSSSYAAGNAKKIVGTVEKTLKSMETLTCTFERSNYRKTDNKTFTIAGTLSLKKPSMLRVEYPAQTIVVDGVTVWTYVPRHKQVQINGFVEGDESFPTPQSIFEKNSKGRRIEVIGTEGIDGYQCDVLQLIPSNPEERNITVWVDRKLSFPVKTLEEYPSGDTVQFTLKKIILNGEIGNEVFTFTQPDGTETVDMRE